MGGGFRQTRGFDLEGRHLDLGLLGPALFARIEGVDAGLLLELRYLEAQGVGAFGELLHDEVEHLDLDFLCEPP